MSRKHKQRTYARNRIFSRRGNEKLQEPDGFYLLKLVVVAILGTLWLKFRAPVGAGAVVVNALPIGLAEGVLLVHWLETSPMNRKIWYATLLIIAIVSYFLPAGIVI